jgi:hypothetical protein
VGSHELLPFAIVIAAIQEPVRIAGLSPQGNGQHGYLERASVDGPEGATKLSALHDSGGSERLRNRQLAARRSANGKTTHSQRMALS